MSGRRLTGSVLAAIAVVSGLLCGMLFAADGTVEDPGKIEASEPRYVPKTHDAWKERGRIVGVAKDAPRFVVEVRTADGCVVKLKEKEKGGAYELEWLTPGVYTLRIVAEGFRPLEIKELEVRAGNDLRIDLEFTAAQE